jgi:hypothetical protein
MRKYHGALFAAAAASAVLTTLGLTAPGAAAVAAAPSAGPTAYTTTQAGYNVTGRWFRYVSTTVTIPAAGPDHQANGDLMTVALGNTAKDNVRAVIQVKPGGGYGSVQYGSGQQLTPFALSPKAGDKVAVSIYYDRHGHSLFTATDLTQGVSRSAGLTVGHVAYNQVSLLDNLAVSAQPPVTDIQTWKLADTRLTTVKGYHGTLAGPWETTPLVATSSGTPAGRLIADTSAPWNNGANFECWLRALPVQHTRAFAGYLATGVPFRFASTILTVPKAPAADADASLATVGLFSSHGFGPFGYVQVKAGGGADSVTYDAPHLPGVNTLAVSPDPGDHLAVSVSYEHGSLRFAVFDLTQHKGDTATVPIGFAAFDTAAVRVIVHNFTHDGKQFPPFPEGQVWAFSHTQIGSYGAFGTLLGPWGTVKQVTMGGFPSVLMHGQDFTVWLHQHSHH